ncbi:hypothetical protein [Allorhodopirellula heiligendammensis]|uniref:Uncharacterized protein n=1 Tax=Allorhodopirellula heiligendammensis TaxID=2714739 RepID=A0A5C6BFA2_9BACT|nr:hypothetical protein [Allorhodopirellula heiligendammensis]TWU10708.1 hypothetical protein Poly21_46140 [Allorhodopirellula heiligendammensis]
MLNQQSHPFRIGLLLSAFLVSIAGCTPKVIVRKNPDDCDRGIRYYRPKPYLKIEPAEIAISKTETSIAPGMVRISLVYLPDFSEEYSISVRSGCGIADVGIKLEDGWNLTEISQELDSQTDENVEAIGSVLSAASGLIPTSANERTAENVSFTVPARNVPIGFYESVVGRDQCNVKRLYGFRYLGFIPFAGCPIEMNGHSHASCQDPGACGQHPAGSLYGLTFVGGEMVFQPLDVMAVTPAVSARALGDKPSAEATTTQPTEIDTPAGVFEPGGVETRLHAYLASLGLEVEAVHATPVGDDFHIRVTIPLDIPSHPIHEAITDWLAERYPNSESFVVQIENESQP